MLYYNSYTYTYTLKVPLIINTASVYTLYPLHSFFNPYFDLL